MIPLSVAILCGGASRRMGTDKALVSLRPGDPPLLALVIDRVRPLTDDLFLVGVSRPGYDQFALPIVPDSVPEGGPLAGIAAALAHATHAACLVVACDMPFLNRRLLTFMAERPRDRFDALVPLIAEDAAAPERRLVYQPLHAIYRATCLEPITRRLAAGDRRVTSFFPDVRIDTIAQDQAERLDPGLRSFFNANTVDSLREARAWLADSPARR